MRRLAVLSILLALVLFGRVSLAQGNASFTGARLANAIANYEGGDLDYEVEITNAGNSALRTDLIIERPGRPGEALQPVKTMAVDIPRSGSAWYRFTHLGGFSAAFCSHGSFYVKLRNGAAPPATVQINPNCTFRIAGLTVEKPNLEHGKPGFLWSHSQTVKTPTCTTGIELTTTVKNQTNQTKTFQVSLQQVSEIAQSSSTQLAPGQSVTLKVAIRGWPEFTGANLPGWTSKLSPQGGDVKQPLFAFKLERTCHPSVSLAQGVVPYY